MQIFTNTPYTDALALWGRFSLPLVLDSTLQPNEVQVRKDCVAVHPSARPVEACGPGRLTAEKFHAAAERVFGRRRGLMRNLATR